MPALSEALRSAPLKTLVLSQNAGIGAAGLDALGKGIAAAGCKLESLELVECQLNDEAIQKFSIHMPSMALKLMDLRNNQLSSAGKSNIEQAWKAAGRPGLVVRDGMIGDTKEGLFL